MRKRFVLWGVAVVGTTSIVDCSIQSLPADSAGGGGASAGKSGSAAHGGGAGEKGGGPGEGGTAGEAGAMDGEPTSSAGAGGSSGSTGGVGGGGGGGIGSAGGTGGASVCGTGAVDTQVSDANCGACGYACVNGRHCSAGRCAPAWQPLSTDNAPAPRTRHVAVALGGKYVVFGGAPSSVGVAMSSTAAYVPATDTWSALSSLNSARCSPVAVSTGSTILTFGGLSDCSNGANTTPGLESFTPDTSGGGSWSTISVSGEPERRYDFAATWTGSALFVYGGGTNTQPYVSSGALFTPSTSSWSDASCALNGCQIGGFAFVDGTVVHVWGYGLYGNAPVGFSYDLVGRFWSPWTLPTGTADHLAGRFADDGRRIYFLTAANVVSVYDRKASSWLVDDTAVMPSGFCIDAAPAWTGSELVAWSGSCGGAPVAVGGRYQPAAPN